MDLAPRIPNDKIILTKLDLGEYTNKLNQKYYKNRFTSYKKDEAQVMYYGSFFNHSCSWNVNMYHDTDDSFFVTNRDIKTNEELTITYVYPELDYEQRQSCLSRLYDFDCKCDRCEKEKAKNI